MADYSGYKTSVGDTTCPTNTDNHIDATQAIATEVENARGAESTLLAKVNTKLDATL